MPTVADTLTRLVFPAALGALGWFFAHVVAEQLMEYYELRKKVHEEMKFIENIGRTNDEMFSNAVIALRRLAAQVLSLEETLHILPRAFLSWRGFDLARASRGLFGLSNNFSEKGFVKAKSRADVQAGLKLPQDYSAEELDAIWVAEERRTHALDAKE